MRMSTTRRVAARRRIAAAATAPLLVLGATACGGSDTAEDPAADPSTSEEAEAEDGQVYDETTILPAMRTAFEDEASTRVQMRMEGAASLSLDGRMKLSDDPSDSEMELTMTGMGSQEFDMRMVDRMIYVSGAPFTPKGKWFAIDPSDSQNPMAQQFSGVIEGSDLNTTFDAFEAGLRDVEHIGPEEIDGEPVQHYRFSVDAAAAMKAQGKQVPSVMPQGLAYDVYLTEDDLMRRVGFEMSGVNAVIDATEWGEDVDVEAPAQEDIVSTPAFGSSG